MLQLRFECKITFATQINLMTKKISFIFLSVLSFVQVSWSQDSTEHLNLQQAITAALSNNNAVKISSLDEEISKAKYRQTNAIFLPQVNFSYTAFTTNNPLNSFGFKLQQKSITTADFDPDLLNHPSSAGDFTTKIEVQQPLINPDLFYQRKGAAIQEEIYELASKRTDEYVAFGTEKAYFNLQMLYSADKVLEDARNTSKAFYKSSKDYFDQGLIQKSDLLNAQVHVMNMESQVKKSKSNISDACNMLSLLMGKPAGTIYTIDTIEMNKPLLTDSLHVPGDRADFKALEKQMDSYDMMIRSSKMNYLPKLNAFASYQLNDNSMFGFNANSYFAGIQLSWNIFNGTRTKNLIAQQTLEKNKIAKQLDQQKKEAELNISQAKHQLNDAMFDISQKQLAIQQATEALRVLENRYAQGLVKTTDVLMAQMQLAEQRLGYVQAVFNYNLASASLTFLTQHN